MNAGKSKMKMGDGKKKLTKKWGNGEIGEWGNRGMGNLESLDKLEHPTVIEVSHLTDGALALFKFKHPKTLSQGISWITKIPLLLRLLDKSSIRSDKMVDAQAH